MEGFYLKRNAHEKMRSIYEYLLMKLWKCEAFPSAEIPFARKIRQKFSGADTYGTYQID